MITLSTVRWLHSGGSFNKLPEHDLGGEPSQFDIAILPYNNLFNDITPEEAQSATSDYRCFYIVNRYQDTDYDITLNLDTTQVNCTSVYLGSVAHNDIQKIIFEGTAPASDSKGYFICQLNWGPQLTVYWAGSYTAMAADLQAKIRMVKYHEGVTVTASGSTLTVTFAGQLQNRKMGLIKIISNHLYQGGIREYRVDNQGASPTTWNFEGTSKVQVHTVISAVPSLGMIHIPYPYNDNLISGDTSTWSYMHLSYINYAGQIFNLQGVIPSIHVFDDDSFDSPKLGNNDEVWVDMPDDPGLVKINVSRVQEGSPINQLAQVIEKKTFTPIGWSDQGTSFHVGLLKPLEGFFIWMKRTPTTTSGCKDKMGISLVGQRVS